VGSAQVAGPVFGAMALPVDKREAAAVKYLQPIKAKFDDDTFEYITQVAASILQEAETRKDAESELEDALVPHLEAAEVADPSAFVQPLLDAVYGAKKAPAAKKAGAKSAASKVGAKAGAKGKASASSKTEDVAENVVDTDVICEIANLILMYGGSIKPLLSNTNFSLRKGHRYGIVGANGAGKTTLMTRVAVGDLPGMENLKCYHLAHEGLLGNVDPNTTCRAYGAMSNPDSDEKKILAALKDVGFDDAMLAKGIGDLSGGWKMRLALGLAMLQGADVFLLDEPTNHLDKDAVKWLEGYLVRDKKQSAMIISHDAGFLNQVCTDVIHFDKDKLVYYPGNFDEFRTATKLDSEGAKNVLCVRGREGDTGESEISQSNEIKAGDDEEMKFPIPGKIDGLSSQLKSIATVTGLNFRYTDDGPLVLKDVSVRLTMGSRIGVVGSNGAGKSTLLNLLAGEIIPPEDEVGVQSSVWRHRNMRFAYIAQHHFTHLGDFMKSTPLHYMQVRFRNGWDEETQKRLTLPQNEEEAEYRKKMAVLHGKRGKAVQSLLSRRKEGKRILYEVKWVQLDDAKQNTYENVQKLRLLGVEKMAAALDDRIACAETGLRPLTTREIVNHLIPFGISEDMTTHRVIGGFSAGQKSKLMIAAAMWTKPHSIAFDEPTNYLDFQTVKALGRAIMLFRGGTIVVSHHAQFVSDTCEEIWYVEEGRVRIQNKDGLLVTKGVAAKNEIARGEKEKAKMDARAQAAEKEAAGPTEQEKALEIHLKARAKMGASKGDIKLSKVDVASVDGTVLLSDTDFTLNQGRRYGLVGRNGSGKSTLLREIAYYKFEKFPKNLKVLLVEQEIMGDDRSPAQWVLDSDIERRILLKEQAQLLTTPGVGDERLKTVVDRLQEIGSDQAESRALVILKGLQFSDELLAGPTSALSGGWRMRVSLASALFAQPELLLLDEPTNHLDFPAVMFLEDYLKSFKNSVIIVSHDRGFLNNVVTDIVWLNGKKLSYQKGDYEQFRITMAETRLNQERAYETQQKEIAHIMEFINKIDFRPKIVAQKASKQKMIDKMEKIEDPADTFADASSLSITFPEPGKLPKSELLQTDGIGFAYPDKAPLFENVSISVDINSRIGVLGANGAGKSTLLKVIQGKLVPQKGSTVVNKNMRVGTFAQHHVEALDLEATCVDCVQSNYNGLTDQEARSILGRFGISGDIALRRISTLSGGQKSRVALSIITYSQPHLIILDEPTNHLDMETIDALIEAVKGFKGAMVMVSHDQHFLAQVATEFWSVARGKVQKFLDLAEAKAVTY